MYNNEEWRTESVGVVLSRITSCDRCGKDNVWQVYSPNSQSGGDILFVKGANASSFELPVGPSHIFRGVRNDSHDAFGVELRLYGGVRPSEAQQAQRNVAAAAAIEAHIAGLKKKAQMVWIKKELKPITEEKLEDQLPTDLDEPPGTLIDKLLMGLPAAKQTPVVAPSPKRASSSHEAGCIWPPSAKASKQSHEADACHVSDSAGRQIEIKILPPKAEIKARASNDSGVQPVVPPAAENEARASNDSAVQPVVLEAPAVVPACPPERPMQNYAHNTNAAWLKRNADINANGANMKDIDTESPEESNAKAIWKTMVTYFASKSDAAHDEAVLFREGQHLRRLMFQKAKQPVPADLWIPGAAPDGEPQFVNTIVSEGHVLHMLMQVLQQRETWLTSQGLPLNTLMRDGEGLERQRFMKYCRDLHAAEPYQTSMQERDCREGGSRTASRMHGRWGRHMQLALGSKFMWEVVSFSGRFDSAFLTKLVTQAAAAAAQRGDLHKFDESVRQEEVEIVTPAQRMKALAHRCRESLRWAKHLNKKRANGRLTFSDSDIALLREFDSGVLLQRTNEAVRAHGHGRLYEPDGSFRVIGQETGGVSRKFLDAHSSHAVDEPIQGSFEDTEMDAVTELGDEDAEAEPIPGSFEDREMLDAVTELEDEELEDDMGDWRTN